MCHRLYLEPPEEPGEVLPAGGSRTIGSLYGPDTSAPLQMITADFNIYDLVLDMRKQRPSLVQTKVILATRALVT